MATEPMPLAQELTPKAKEEGISRMQAHLSRRSGRERTREDARAAFENLLGLYATVCEWKARAALEDQAAAIGAAPAPRAPDPAPAAPEPKAPRTYRRKKTSRGHKATTAE